MPEKVFWLFFVFGLITVALACAGGVFAMTQAEGFQSRALGSILFFLGVSLAILLGSLLFIKRKGDR